LTLDNLQTGCQTAIHRWATPETQSNAALLGEHTEFVKTVIKMYRDRYHHLVQTGATEWSDDATLEAYISDICPWN